VVLNEIFSGPYIVLVQFT